MQKNTNRFKSILLLNHGQQVKRKKILNAKKIKKLRPFHCWITFNRYKRDNVKCKNAN